MPGEFIIMRNGREVFVSEDELRRTAARGQLAPGDLVYHPVLGRWLYAKEVEEVRAEMTAAAALGRPTPAAASDAINRDAVAGFVLGVLGHVPLLGVFSCLLGIYFSSRGLKRAALLDNRGHGLAVAGMILSIVFLVPAAAYGVIALDALTAP
jgi:hypothetical protein